jgi:hypothetical protein
MLLNADPALDLRGPVATAPTLLASALVVPVALPDGSRGALALYAEAADAFTLEDARRASAAAAQFSDGLGRATRGGERHGKVLAA